MNKVFLIGNLTKDPEARVTANGVSVCSFVLAVGRRFANQDGEKMADFIPVVTWRGLADSCAKYLHKGSKIAVSGMMQTRSYEAQDGSKRNVTEIVADEVQFLMLRSNAAEPSEEIPGYSVVEDEAEEYLPF